MHHTDPANFWKQICLAVFSLVRVGPELLIGVLLLLSGFTSVAQHVESPLTVTNDKIAPAVEALVDRGRYLADAGNCFSCHTRKHGEPFSGGVPFKTPFGTIYSTNITPDPETGIGEWTAMDLRRAMHDGIARDGSRLFPAFPYSSYTNVLDEDVDAIHAFLQTLKPVRYSPPRNGILFSQRWAIRIWNYLFFQPGRFVPDPNKSTEWNRGAYLVDGLGHCGSCHTPRGMFMEEIRSRAYQGGAMLDHALDGKERRWFAVNLTSVAGGLAAWSEDELTRYLHTGFSRRAGTFGPMNDVIINSLSKLAADDVRAMAIYVKDLPMGGEYAGEGVPSGLVDGGRSVYEERCEKCHGESGRGGIFSGPPLVGSAIVQASDPSSLFNVILHGPQIPKNISFGQWETMSSYADILSDAEIAAVSNYIRGSWGNKARAVEAKEVARQR